MPTTIATITSFDCEFIHGGDLHLLRNNVWAPNLDELILVKFDKAQTRGFSIKELNDNSIPATDPDIAYKPADFKKARLGVDMSGFVSLSTTPDIIQNDAEGLQVNIKTGAIKTAVPTGGTYSVSNFLLYVVFYDLSDVQQNIFNFMVHTHPGVSKVWLTPSTLSLVVGNPKIRFHLLAEFSDGVVGNIVNCPAIIWNAENPLLKTDGRNGRIYVNSADEAAAVSAGSIKVWATLPPYLVPTGGTALATTKQKVNISASYQGTNFLKAKLLPKSVGNTKNVDTANNMNILFIAEGFKSSEKNNFKQIVTGIVNEIKSNHTFLPWNILPINFWSLFKASEESFISYYYEVLALIHDAGLDVNGQPIYLNVAWPIETYLTFMDNAYLVDGKQMPLLKSPTLPATIPSIDKTINYLLGDLIQQIGFPTSNDISKTKSQKITEWNTLYPGSFATTPPGTASLKFLNDVVFEAWKLLSKRTITNQKDTFLGMSYGAVSSFGNLLTGAAREISLSTGVSDSSERVNRKALNKMLLNLRADHDTNLTIGPLWTTPDIDMGTDAHFGKDFANVVIIAKGASVGGSNYSDQENGWLAKHSLSLAQSLGTGPLFRYNTVTGSKEISLDTSAYPFSSLVNTSILGSLSATTIHELSHSYKLLDEYGGSRNFNSISADTKKKINASYNLQDHDSLLNGANLDGSKIKWRWKRIRKAGVLTAQPQGSAPPFVVNLKPGNGAKFLMNDEVFLRKKDNFGPDGEITEGAISPKFKVTNVAGDAITIALVNTGTVTPGDFPANSLLCALAEDPASANSFYELVPTKIRNFITTGNKVLTGACSSTADKTGIQFPTELPAELKATPAIGLTGLMDIVHSMFRYRIVGLYAAGDEYDCNVYHPTGFCLMRSLEPAKPYSKGNTIESEFCPVCRFALVSQLAPDLHDKIDEVYEKYYTWLYKI